MYFDCCDERLSAALLPGAFVAALCLCSHRVSTKECIRRVTLQAEIGMSREYAITYPEELLSGQ